MTLLTIAQDVAARVGIPQPSSVTSVDIEQAQLLAIVQRVATDLAREVNWTALSRVHEFTTVAAERQPLAIPDGFWRFQLIDGKVILDASDNSVLTGPLTPGQWARVRPTQEQPVMGSYWRVLGRDIYLRQPPVAGVTIRFEYITRNFITGDDGEKSRFTANEDVTVLDEDLITLGTIWRWKRDQGLDYAEEMSDYERAKEMEAGRDGGPQVIYDSNDYSNCMPEPLWPGYIPAPQ